MLWKFLIWWRGRFGFIARLCSEDFERGTLTWVESSELWRIRVMLEKATENTNVQVVWKNFPRIDVSDLAERLKTLEAKVK